MNKDRILVEKGMGNQLKLLWHCIDASRGQPPVCLVHS